MLNVDALPMTPSMQDSAAGGPPCAMGWNCVAVHSYRFKNTGGAVWSRDKLTHKTSYRCYTGHTGKMHAGLRSPEPVSPVF